MLLMTERLALQERQLADAERTVQAVKEGRCVAWPQSAAAAVACTLSLPAPSCMDP